MDYHNCECRHSGLTHRAPVVYLKKEGVHPSGFVETTLPRSRTKRAMRHAIQGLIPKILRALGLSRAQYEY